MTALAGSPAAAPGALRRRIAGLDDGVLMRGAFYCLLVLVIAVLAVDYRDLRGSEAAVAARSGDAADPAVWRPGSGQPAPGSADPKIRSDPEALRQAMRIELGQGCVLRLDGTITPGMAGRFAAEVDRVGEYVRTIELDSPGGSVADALAMSRLIRERGYATHVAAGRLCASSCPILFAGGIERAADDGAAIGVHQVSTRSNADVPAEMAVSHAQAVTASVTRHLAEMGIEPALWLHALDTPPDQIYFLSGEEMRRFRLVSDPPQPGTAKARRRD